MEHKTGLEDYYVIKNNKKMRFGYTTGSCAAAAAKGAVWMLLHRERISSMKLMTPKGILLDLLLQDTVMEEDFVSCAVQKDGGDDPDTTHGLLIYAKARKIPGTSIVIDGGKGVGRVTRPGLSQKIGEAAINPVPRAMIEGGIREIREACGYEGGLEVIISVPMGEETAQKTFNPRLGILGGISILGTSGIVEPMSEKALIQSIGVELRSHLAQGRKYLIVTPGNYGADYLKEHMDLPFEDNVKCSNYVGETIDMAVEMGAEGVLFISHIGKFVKVGGGIMNTHSHHADARMEVLAAAAIRTGCDLSCARDVLDANTTDEALEMLERHGHLQPTMEELMKKIQFYLDHRSYSRILLGAVIFSGGYGYLGQTENAQVLIDRIREQAQQLKKTALKGDKA